MLVFLPGELAVVLVCVPNNAETDAGYWVFRALYAKKVAPAAVRRIAGTRIETRIDKAELALVGSRIAVFTLQSNEAMLF